jgi:PhzF family phenazine biosynthesis protein
MNVLRIAAFSDGEIGGNPAGVSIDEALPPADVMQQIASDIGYSETAFAAPVDEGWRVRYFSPQSEVPFCGHATIALGAALALRHGNRVFKLQLNTAAISVEGHHEGKALSAALQSPPTRSVPADPAQIKSALELFGLAPDDLDSSIPPGAMHAGADHIVLALRLRPKLAGMRYDLVHGREFMRSAGLVTIALVHVRSSQEFDVRNAFASGGVLEDPATGAAAAAFAGYLRDLGWPHGGVINIVQGEDMGMRSLIRADIPHDKGKSIRISGSARLMN